MNSKNSILEERKNEAYFLTESVFRLGGMNHVTRMFLIKKCIGLHLWIMSIFTLHLSNGWVP